MSTISVVVSAYNEEKKLDYCLASVVWADEIIVIDNESTDKTAEIAKKYTTKVFSRPNHRMLNTNKNYGFEKATSDWILNLDADESIPIALKEEIQRVLSHPIKNDGYKIPRKNILFNKWIKHGLWWPDYQIRLFRRNSGRFPEKHVHEYIQINGKIDTLNEPIHHINYESISQFFRKLDSIYTENEVENKITSGYRLVWYDVLRWPVADFIKIYFAQQGFKDGLHGLILSLFQAMYAIVIFAKIWEREHFPDVPIAKAKISREINDAGKQVQYWKLTTELSTEHNPIKQLVKKIQRKMIS